MNTRKLLYEKNSIGSIDQGSIFNCGYSVDYETKQTWGVIITPRCDITNDKVSTLHYLPIVRYSDWLVTDLYPIIYESVLKDKTAILSNYLVNKGLSKEIIVDVDSISFEKVLRANKVNSKDLKAFLDAFEKYVLIRDFTPVHNAHKLAFLKENEKFVRGVIREITKFQRRSFYFLEPWDSSYDESVFVVLLREIRSISKEFARLLSKGCYMENVKRMRYDETSFTLENTFAFVEAVIQPPFIEHLIQTFFHNIGRIGIDDYDNEIEKTLLQII